MKQIKQFKNKILLGDLHFGIKKFSESFLKNQLDFFFKDVFPYMEKHNIDEIIQFGDIFDNRVTVDIKFLNEIDNFFKELQLRKITFYTLLGNHDIYYRNSREVSLIEFFAKKYNNIILFKEKTVIDFEGAKCLFVPWIVKNEKLYKEDLKDIDFVFGHFEIRNFQISPGIIDKDSELTEDFFQNVKEVFSGHYHLKGLGNKVKYIGTPYQLNWSDFNDFKGFYDFDGVDLKFIENKTSKKFVKIFIFKDKFIIKGLEKEDLYFDISEFENKINEIKDKCFIKIIEKENNADIKIVLNKSKIDVPVIREIKVQDFEGTKLSNVENYIIKVIKDNDENLLKYYNNLLEKIKKEEV